MLLEKYLNNWILFKTEIITESMNKSIGISFSDEEKDEGKYSSYTY